MKKYMSNLKLIKEKCIFLLKNYSAYNPFEKYPLYFILTVFLPLIAGVRRIAYHINDDFSIRVLLEGSMFSPREPSEYVLFINVFYARFIKFLYLHFPTFFWYDLLLILPVFIGSVVVSKIFYSVSDKNTKIILSFLLMVFSYTVVHNLTFTIIAGACSVYGLIIVTSCFLEEGADRGNIKKFIAFSLLVLSSLIRYDEMILCLFFGSVFFLVRFWKEFPLKKIIRFYLIVFLSVGTAFSLNYLHIKEYAKITDPFNPLEYNAIKSEFTDKAISYEGMGKISSSDDEELNKALIENNISQNDFHLLMNWGFSGKNFFNIDNMKKFKYCCSKQIQGNSMEKLKKIKVYFTYKIFVFSLLFISLFCFFWNEDYKIFTENLFIVLTVVSFSVFVVPFIPKPLPMRVLLPVYFLIIYFISIRAFEKRSSIIISLFICMFIWLPFYNIPQKKRLKIAFQPSNSSMVYYGMNFSDYVIYPFKKSPDYIKNLYFWGWPVSTPSFQKKFKEDIYTMLLKNEAALLVYGRDFSSSYSFEIFIKEHFGKYCYTDWKLTSIPNLYLGKLVCGSSSKDVEILETMKCHMNDAFCKKVPL